MDKLLIYFAVMFFTDHKLFIRWFGDG